LNHGVTASFNINNQRFIDHRTGVSIRPCYRRKGKETVELRNDTGILLYLWNIPLCMMDQLVVNPLLYDKQLLFRMEDLLFVNLELLRDVPLGVHQRLLPDPVGRYLVFIGVAYFEIVAKDLIEGNLQGRNNRPLDLALLN